MKHFFTLISVLFFAPAFAQERSISITFDDLPCVNCKTHEEATEINEKILSILHQYSVPAIGFVNENKLYLNGQLQEERVQTLRLWLEGGFELGNHTFSHVNPNETGLKDYKKDVLDGERLLRPLIEEFGSELRFFRHPYLRHGPTPAYKEELDLFLSEQGYIVAPVTVDNDEYIYAWCYRKAKLAGDFVAMRRIAYDYIAYMRGMILHYEQEAQSFFGREISQTLLLHANELNSDYLPFLLDYLKKERNYSFISLETALEDAAYAHPEGYTEHGRSWMYRWQKAKDVKSAPMPEISAWMQKIYDNYQGDKAPDLQKFSGPEADLLAIQEKGKQFSKAYMSKDSDQLANCYAPDGILLPDHSLMLEGRDAIRKYWILPDAVSVTLHVLTPQGIEVLGETAYDFGYCEERTRSVNGHLTCRSGKYVILWKKIDGEWSISLAIWNQL